MTEKDGSQFAAYDGFQIEYRDASHRYWLHEGEIRTPIVSVTTMLGIIDKPALRKWYGNVDSAAVLEAERAGKLRNIEPDAAIHVLRQRGLGAEAQREAGAERGTAVHDALERFCTTGTVPTLSDYPDAVRGYVQALCGALIDLDPQPILIEQIVASPTHRYAGRFDLIADIGGQRTLLDLKTSSNAGTYRESHLQLAGYELTFSECGIDPVEASMILELSQEGTYRAVPGIGRTDRFLSVLAAYRDIKATDADLKAREKLPV